MLIIDHLQQSSQRSSGHLARFGWKQSEALSVGSSLTDLSERVRPACSHSALPAATISQSRLLILPYAKEELFVGSMVAGDEWRAAAEPVSQRERQTGHRDGRRKR